MVSLMSVSFVVLSVLVVVLVVEETVVGFSVVVDVVDVLDIIFCWDWGAPTPSFLSPFQCVQFFHRERDVCVYSIYFLELLLLLKPL